MINLPNPITKDTTVETMWKSFIGVVYPYVQEDSVQYTEMRKSFYAACLCMFQWFLEQGKEDEEQPTKEDMDRLDVMHNELMTFMFSVVNDAAARSMQ